MFKVHHQHKEAPKQTPALPAPRASSGLTPYIITERGHIMGENYPWMDTYNFAVNVPQAETFDNIIQLVDYYARMVNSLVAGGFATDFRLPANAPTITSITPSTVPAGGGIVNFVMVGTNFSTDTGHYLTVNGVEQPHTRISSTQINFSVDTSTLAAGSVPVNYVNLLGSATGTITVGTATVSAAKKGSGK